MHNPELLYENIQLKERISELENELKFLKTHPVFVSGIKGETFICELLDGELTDFAESHDIKAGKYTFEVKYSNLGVAVKGRSTMRWSWSKPLGWLDKGKDYDYLILLGEKDKRYSEQYIDTSPFVCFLIPRNKVESLMFQGKAIGGLIQLTTNFKNVRNPQSLQLLNYMIDHKKINKILESNVSSED